MIMRFFIEGDKRTTTLVKLKNIIEFWSCWKLILCFIHHLKLVHSFWNLLAFKAFHQAKFWSTPLITKSVHLAWLFDVCKCTSLMLLLLFHGLIGTFWITATFLKLRLIVIFSLLRLSHAWIFIPINFFIIWNFFSYKILNFRIFNFDVPIIIKIHIINFNNFFNNLFWRLFFYFRDILFINNHSFIYFQMCVLVSCDVF